MNETIQICVIAICVTCVVCCLLVMGPIYYNKKNVLMSETIKAGGDPIAVACAFDNDYHTPACLKLK